MIQLFNLYLTIQYKKVKWLAWNNTIQKKLRNIGFINDICIYLQSYVLNSSLCKVMWSFG